MTPAHFAVITGLLFAVSAHAADPNWIQITSDHFRVFSSAKERETRVALDHLERVHSFFAQVTGRPGGYPVPLDVVIFGSEKEYAPVRPSEFAAAFYQGQAERDYIVIGKTGEQAEKIVAHEYTHLAFQRDNYNLPPWLDEGVAELFSTLKAAGKNTEFGDLIPGHFQTLISEKWVPLKTIMEADHSSPYYNESKRAGVFYSESWALVHMIATSGNPEKFASLLEAVRKGTPAMEAVQKIFAPLAELDNSVQLYVRNGRYSRLSTPIRLAPVDKIPATPADTFTVRMILADLLAGRQQKQGEARTRYEELKREDPTRPGPWAGLAYLDWHANDRQGAAGNFAKAFELGARSPKLLNDFARLASQSHPEPALAAMQAFVELQPGNIDARIDLATMQMSQRKYTDALATSKAISTVNTTAQRDRLLYVRASAALQAGDRAEARKIAAELDRLTAAPELKQRAGEMLRFLDQTEARERELTRRNTIPDPAPVRDAAAIVAPVAPPSPPDASPALLYVVSGKLVEMVCQTPGKMILETEGIKLEFLILDPNRLIVTGRGPGPAQLACGPQKPPVAVRLEYDKPPEGSRAAGVIRAVHFETN